MGKMLSCEVIMGYLMLGSYSSQKQVQLGTGRTTHNQHQSIMWLAAQLPSLDISIQPLDSSSLPTGLVATICSSVFFQQYFPESDSYDRYLRPGIKKMSEWMGAVGTPMPRDTPDRETGLFLRGFLAILHGASGMAVRKDDPDTLRAFAHQAVEMHFSDQFQISIATAAIRQRKERNYPLAVDFYSRALQVKEDDHLLFNIARTYYEMKNIEAAKDSLTRALAINPEFTAARQFIDFLTATSTG